MYNRHNQKDFGMGCSVTDGYYKKSMEESYKKAAEKLGLGDRIESETQLLASGFTSVNLEGIAPFDDSIASFDYQTNQMIKNNWEARTELHPGMFPGPLASVRKFVVEDGTLNFALKRSGFDILTD